MHKKRKLSAISYQLSAISYQLLAISYQLMDYGQATELLKKTAKRKVTASFAQRGHSRSVAIRVAWPKAKAKAKACATKLTADR